MTKTFVQVVSDVLRQNTILSGNDSDIIAFSDTQHQATIQLAKISVQSTLNQIVSESRIPYERTEATITFIDGIRIYNLPSDFIRFYGKKPFMLQLDSSDNSDNRFLYEYPGGLNRLESIIPQYREQAGTPWHWYIIEGPTEQVGFYQVPDSSVATLKVRFIYEKEVMVNTEADVLPFTRVSQEIAFTDLVSRYFMVLNAGENISRVEQDPAYMSAKAVLHELIRYKQESRRYGYNYR